MWTGEERGYFSCPLYTSDSTQHRCVDPGSNLVLESMLCSAKLCYPEQNYSSFSLCFLPPIEVSKLCPESWTGRFSLSPSILLSCLASSWHSAFPLATLIFPKLLLSFNLSDGMSQTCFLLLMGLALLLYTYSQLDWCVFYILAAKIVCCCCCCCNKSFNKAVFLECCSTECVVSSSEFENPWWIALAEHK